MRLTNAAVMLASINPKVNLPPRAGVTSHHRSIQRQTSISSETAARNTGERFDHLVKSRTSGPR